MKDTDTEKLRRSQPVKSAELDRRLLERAEKLTEGRKTIGESREPVFSVLNAKEDNTMDKNTNITEVRSHKPAAFAAIAAVLVLVAGGAVYASRYNTTRIDTVVPAAQSETDRDSADTEGQTKPGDYYTADGKKANDWAEKYLAQNEDTFGYISIPDLEFEDGTRAIDFPVAIADDNNYYQTHAFDKSENASGCIFAKAGTEVGADGSQPQIIQLFGSASFSDFSWDYDSEYWRIRPEAGADTEKPGFTALLFYNMSKAISQAPVIEFKTIWQDGGEYMIFGCTTVQGDALGIGKVDDIGEWVSGIRDLSEFDVDIDCGADDKYLVLDLCEGGRSAFRVFAKKLDEDDDKQKIIDSYSVNSSEGAEREGKAADIRMELPVNMRGMYTLEVYIDDERVFDYVHDPVGNYEETFTFPVYGEGKKQAIAYIIDPLSSDLTKGKVEYARFDVDFDSNDVTLVGKYNTEGAQALVDKYAREVELEYLMPAGVDGAFFEVCVDGNLIDTFRYDEFDEKVAAKNRKLKYTAWYPGTKECRVTLYTVLDNHRFEYASYLVDFLNGTYKYAEGGEEKAGMLEAYTQGKARCVFIEIPVPEGYDKNVAFEAYYEDIHMGTAEYTKYSVMPDPFGIALIEDGVDRISINAVFEDKTVKDYMVMDVDFDIMTYEFTPDGEPELGLFDQLK